MLCQLDEVVPLTLGFFLLPLAVLLSAFPPLPVRGGHVPLCVRCVGACAPACPLLTLSPSVVACPILCCASVLELSGPAPCSPS